MDRKILKWMLTGDTGMSSEAIAAKMAGIDNGNTMHPFDPSDLNRCVEFFKAVPEAKERIGEMREVSPSWNKIVEAWDTLTAKLSEELSSRDDRRAPETYKMMKAILDS